MTTTIKRLVERVQELSPDVAAEVRNYTEFLLARRRSTATRWAANYFTDAIGALPDFPDVDNDTDRGDPALDAGNADLHVDVP